MPSMPTELAVFKFDGYLRRKVSSLKVVEATWFMTWAKVMHVTFRKVLFHGFIA